MRFITVTHVVATAIVSSCVTAQPCEIVMRGAIETGELNGASLEGVPFVYTSLVTDPTDHHVDSTIGSFVGAESRFEFEGIGTFHADPNGTAFVMVNFPNQSFVHAAFTSDPVENQDALGYTDAIAFFDFDPNDLATIPDLDSFDLSSQNSPFEISNIAGDALRIDRLAAAEVASVTIRAVPAPGVLAGLVAPVLLRPCRRGSQRQ